MRTAGPRHHRSWSVTPAIILTMVVLFGVTAEARAGIVIFTGIDPGAGPGDPRPNADAAAASFDAAAGLLGTSNLIDFESMAFGIYTDFSPVPGVNVAMTNQTTSFNTISADFDAANGYNTTPGGEKFLLLFPEDTTLANKATFSFDAPIQAFGAYFTGIGSQPGSLTVRFNDGSDQSLPITGDPSGGVRFFGFTDAGASITQITLDNEPVNGVLNDAVGVDDIRFVNAAAVPEPSSLVLAGIATLAGAVTCMRRRAASG